MKYPSNFKIWTLAVLSIILPAAALAGGDLFSVVPPGDATYAQLSQLEKAGLLPDGESSKVLTRFEVARKILQAQEKYGEIVVAQADDIPPPPGDTDSLAPTTAPASPAVLSAAPAASAPAPPPAAPAVVPAAPSQAELAQAEKNLHSLAEAYQFELKRVEDEVKSRESRAAAVDASQYDIFQRLKGFTDYPNVAFHGLGRAFAFSRQYYGDYNFPDPGYRETWGYLDLKPTGAISKQVKWDAILRFQTRFQPDLSTDSMNFQRITMVFSPDWFTATVGDFDESYTPFTLWNRNNLDLKYIPEMVARRDSQEKYESYFDNATQWPFRGLRIGTELAWADSPVVERFKASVFANMIANGFNADTKNGNFFGPTNFTDWVFGGQASLASKKWYFSNLSLQLNLGAQGVILDEPLDTNTPGTLYNTTDPSTWAHQYLVGSWTPDLRLGFGGNFYFGLGGDLAFSSYQDDKRDNNKIISDYAATGGAYFQLEQSKISFSFLDVGPSYYSPLAQVRQDLYQRQDLFNGPTVRDTTDIFQTPLRSRFLFTNVPRPSGIFSFYDRTEDNTFPYGLGTPNRQGLGIDLDVKALEKQALKIKGSVYFVQEISGNLVSNPAQTSVTVLDGTAAVPVPMRTFTYINVGPSLNIGPLIQWDRDLEIGANVRYEQTSSGLGTLDSAWILSGIKVGVLPALDVTAAYSYKRSKGADAGYGGTTFARYPYIFDNTDINPPLGLGYSVFYVDNQTQSLKLSTAFHANRNSNFYLDYSLTTGITAIAPLPAATLNNQYMELTYEIMF